MLFILVIEGLTRIILDAQHKGHIIGFQYSHSLSLTHLLFVDDVILYGIGTVEEWGAYKEALDLLCSATNMANSAEKSSFLYQNVDEDTCGHIAAFLPYSVDFRVQIFGLSFETSRLQILWLDLDGGDVLK